MTHDNHITFRNPVISPEALALLGGGKIAYVRTIRSEDVQKQFPQAQVCRSMCMQQENRHQRCIVN